MRPTEGQDFNALAGFIHGLRSSDIPPEALHMGRRCLVDTLAVWAGGSTSAPARIARDHAAKRYPGDLPLPFDGRGTNPVGFAFAGAAGIDALDGHDGHQLCKGHASVALVPALLAELGMAPDCGWDDLLAHLVVGEEVAIRAGLSLHASAADYHSSGAWNALGVAAIGARLRGFDTAQTRHALGIAEYYGPRAPMMRCIDHPSMVKDSSSWGALTGVSAVDLAEDGFTGAPAAICEESGVAEFWADLGQRWRILETNFKAYPVCRWAHPPIEAALGLMRDHGIAADAVEHVTVATFAEATRLATRRPADGDEAQYSLPLTMAVAMREGGLAPRVLLPDAFATPEVWALVDRIEMVEDDEANTLFPGERIATVTLTLTDGRVVTSPPTAARGNFDAPLPDEEILGKLSTYAADVVPSAELAQVASLLITPQKASPPDAVLAGFLRGVS